MMLEIQALQQEKSVRASPYEREEVSYNKPVANTADIPHFLRFEICNCQTLLMGRNRRMKSATELNTADARIPAAELIHRPGIKGFQIFSRGTQARARNIKQAA